MSYNPQMYASVKAELEKKRRKAIADADKRIEELDARYPEIREIDTILQTTALRIMEALSMGKAGLEERMQALKEENDLLLAKKAQYLVSRGYPANYTDPQFSCKTCEDTGYADGKMCTCFREALFRAGVARSGLGKLPEKQSFANFDLCYYSDPETVGAILNYCRRYAEAFCEKTTENILLTGATGLGKTHLSTAIGQEVIRNGYDCIYTSAQNLLSDFEYERFGRSFKDDSPDKTEQYFTCDLLIIDDFGTEMGNTFTVASLYNLINSRMNAGKPMIINTNLSSNDLRKHYDDRIASRLFGEFIFFRLQGTDIRQQKRMKQS